VIYALSCALQSIQYAVRTTVLYTVLISVSFSLPDLNLYLLTFSPLCFPLSIAKLPTIGKTRNAHRMAVSSKRARQLTKSVSIQKGRTEQENTATTTMNRFLASSSFVLLALMGALLPCGNSDPEPNCCRLDPLAVQDAVASTTEASRLAASNAVDGDLDTRWASANGPPEDDQYLMLDFGQEVYIDSVKLVWQSSYSKDYKIEKEVSVGGWTTMAYYQGDDAMGGEVLAVDLDSVTSKILIQSYESQGQYGISLKEVSVFGDTDVACVPCPQNRDYCKFDQLTIADISVSSNPLEGANVIDNDPTTRWVSDSDFQELFLDFGEEVYVDSILFQWDFDYSKIYKIYTWHEEYDNWSLFNVEQVTNAGGHVRFSGVDRVTSKIYVLSLLFGQPSPPISLWEIQVFGDPNQDCIPVKTIYGPA
jgi:hypothetical protein